MRRLLSGLLAAGLLASPYAEAAQCTNPADQTVFDLEGLKSELMVLATGCQGADGDYNAFVNKFKPVLGANDQAFAAYFRRAYGRNGQREQDAYITNLANAQSETGLRQGSEFCPRNAMIFHEVMALPDDRALPEYAAGKDLIPAQLGSCATAPAPAPVRSAAAHTRTTKHH